MGRGKEILEKQIEQFKGRKMNGIAPPGIYTSEKGDQIEVTWHEYDQAAYYKLLKKIAKEDNRG